MITATPLDTPVTIPVVMPIVANAVLLLLQVPPVLISESVAADPAQIFAAPVIANGKGFTVITDSVIQPVGSV